VLELVAERGHRPALHVRLAPHVPVDRPVRVGHGHVEHLGVVAAATRAVARPREEVALPEEAADHEVGAARRLGVDGAREEDDRAAVAVEVRGLAEVRHVRRVRERVEGDAERAVLVVGEAAGRVAVVGDDDRPLRDGDDAAGAEGAGHRVARRLGARVQAQQVADRGHAAAVPGARVDEAASSPLHAAVVASAAPATSARTAWRARAARRGGWMDGRGMGGAGGRRTRGGSDRRHRGPRSAAAGGGSAGDGAV
jgi:hypothetical protein